MKIEENFNKKLLVEGNDDQHVMRALRKKHSIPETFDIIDCEGIDKVLTDFDFRLSKGSKELDTLAVVVDADTDIDVRWQSLRNILVKNGYTIPQQLPAEGLFIDTQTPKIAVWVMPDNQTSGMLEDFIRLLIPQDDELLPVAEDVLGDIEAKQLNRYSTLHKPKALIHTWLAWQEEPGRPMGQAITKKYLQDTETCQLFVSWLKKVFA